MQSSIIYFWNIIVLLEKTVEHIKHFSQILHRPEDAKSIKPFGKCYFFFDTIYLGQVIRPKSCKLQSNLQRNMPLVRSTPRMEIESFIGLCKDFYRFIPNFAWILDPFSKKLPKNQSQKFKGYIGETIDASTTIPDHLISLPLLAQLSARTNTSSTLMPVKHQLGLSSFKNSRMAGRGQLYNSQDHSNKQRVRTMPQDANDESWYKGFCTSNPIQREQFGSQRGSLCRMLDTKTWPMPLENSPNGR